MVAAPPELNTLITGGGSVWEIERPINDQSIVNIGRRIREDVKGLIQKGILPPPPPDMTGYQGQDSQVVGMPHFPPYTLVSPGVPVYITNARPACAGSADQLTTGVQLQSAANPLARSSTLRVHGMSAQRSNTFMPPIQAHVHACVVTKLTQHVCLHVCCYRRRSGRCVGR
jgi:hypothetical protein